MRHRKPVAAATILVVLWTALWPLVSSARAVFAGEAMPLCHQAGMMVEPAMAPPPPAAPGSDETTKTHCPLCMMAFYAGFTTAPRVATPGFFTRAPHALAIAHAVPHGTGIHLPQGRAPPDPR